MKPIYLWMDEMFMCLTICSFLELDRLKFCLCRQIVLFLLWTAVALFLERFLLGKNIFVFCMCSKVLTMVRVSVAHFFAYPALYCWFLQGEPIKDTSPPSIAPCDVILSLAHLKPSFRAANFWVLSLSRVALETVVSRISNSCRAEFSLVKNLV